MWLGAGVAAGIVAIVVVVVVVVVARRRRARPDRTTDATPPLPEVHFLDEALRSVESLTDAKGSSLLDQTDRTGRTIRDRLASGEAHIDELRRPDDTSPLLRRVLDEVAGDTGEADGPPAPTST